MIDLRSDTVTQPSPEMRQAMANAEVGDDVICIDPTVQRLQDMTADILGKEAALFVPSGSMSNQLAVRVHCQAGDEFICEADCHIYNYEQAAYAQLSGVAARPVAGQGNVLEVDQLRDLIRPNDDHQVRTKLVCLENTHNRGAGRVLPYDTVESICRWAHDNGLQTHLDGARLFNAEAASGIDAADWAQHFDTVSVCFSKGLGAPVGSALAGPRKLIDRARRNRKLFGGAMRQAGIIAAGAAYALEHNRRRLTDDHESAQIIAEGVRNTPGLSLSSDTVDTNIVIFQVDPQLAPASDFAGALLDEGVWMLAFGGVQIRAVTHLHITPEDAQRAADMLGVVAERFASGTQQVISKGDSY